MAVPPFGLSITMSFFKNSYFTYILYSINGLYIPFHFISIASNKSNLSKASKLCFFIIRIGLAFKKKNAFSSKIEWILYREKRKIISEKNQSEWTWKINYTSAAKAPLRRNGKYFLWLLNNFYFQIFFFWHSIVFYIHFMVYT